MNYRYFICDVFTKEKFGGNQLAVFPEAVGLSEIDMQNIAKEFNFSETAFVFPPEGGHTKKIRIYTPTTEVPFAGHPTIGTAFALAQRGDFGDIEKSIKVTFEEKAGTVQVGIRRDDEDGITCELKAPSELIIGEYVPKQLIADTLSLRESEIVTTTHAPQMASVGLPFIFVELSSLSALQQAEISMPEFQKLLNRGFESFIHLYCRNIDGFDIRARMFAPMDGVLEDPATGSANCALIGLLSYHDPRADLNIKWTISQGTEIGRPSILHGRSEKINGHVTNTWIGGSSVLISEGVLRL